MRYISEKITSLLQEFSEPLVGIMDIKEEVMVGSVSQQKPLFKGLSYSIYLIIRHTSVANNKSKSIFCVRKWMTDPGQQDRGDKLFSQEQ